MTAIGAGRRCNENQHPLTTDAAKLITTRVTLPGYLSFSLKHIFVYRHVQTITFYFCNHLMKSFILCYLYSTHQAIL